ncbi:Peptide chain release factor domain-containing protein [Desulfonema limicola]|uniref:Peptide chain release factor domain-containing protein n=1 Tax=Desulfonema limicola TaxID=45656 RepID=A0A975BB69_9BACT|nr:PCRF domain-containing protein [Desulfonema limicola]QTA82429.1 Peptide chain release factor domain-containing protein [Desulfonema limicola]
MGWTKKHGSEKIFTIIVIFAIIITISLGIWWFWFQDKPEQETADSPARIVDNPVEPPKAEPLEPETVIRYNKDDKDFQELMKQRKAEYGLDKGVDMIVTENESVEIGDTVIPMEEILNKIRLQKGQVVEQDIGTVLTAQRKKESIERLFEKLKESEERFWELEKQLSAGESVNPEIMQEQTQEHAELSEIIKKYQLYKETLQNIETRRQILESDDRQQKTLELIKNLEEKKHALEKELKKQVTAKTLKDIPDDNISILLEALDKIEDNFFELEAELDKPEILEQKDIFQKKVRERAALRQIVSGYNLYKQIIKDIEETKTLLDDDKQGKEILENRLAGLRIQRDDLENFLKSKLLPDESLDVYGVYIVRPGDNVWNIHFAFLKEYFKSRNILLSSSADEPLRPGVSSGVGKILKFSENMVYIFNLHERRLSFDLHIIHPLSKIVVFNMGQVFGLLNQVDYTNIRHIRFDGENIWIPAEQ